MGRTGLVLEKNRKHARVLFMKPFTTPAVDIIIPNDLITTVKPKLAYPPIYKRERFEMYGRVWNVAEAWRIITTERPKIEVPVSKVDLWAFAYLGQMDVDREAALSDMTDLSVPVLFVNLRGKDDKSSNALLIDGWRRLYKAYHTKQPLTAYMLVFEEEHYIRVKDRRNGQPSE